MTGLVLPSRKLLPNLALKHLGHALRPRSADDEEEEKEKAHQEAAHRLQGEEHNTDLTSGTSSEDGEGDEEDDLDRCVSSTDAEAELEEGTAAAGGGAGKP